MAKRHTQTQPPAERKPSSEELGTVNAYRHRDVIKHAKYSAARKVAKRFIELYGLSGRERNLAAFDMTLAVETETKLRHELEPKRIYASDAITIGIRVAWYALEDTYTGPKKVGQPKARERANKQPGRNTLGSALNEDQIAQLHELAEKTPERMPARRRSPRDVVGAPVKSTKKRAGVAPGTVITEVELSLAELVGTGVVLGSD